jgi:hypothetical protein
MCWILTTGQNPISLTGFDRGCVKTPRSFHTLVVLVCFRGLRSIRSRKIAKNFRLRDRSHFFHDFLHSLGPRLCKNFRAFSHEPVSFAFARP